jgi:hypothetical protein
MADPDICPGSGVLEQPLGILANFELVSYSASSLDKIRSQCIDEESDQADQAHTRQEGFSPMISVLAVC